MPDNEVLSDRAGTVVGVSESTRAAAQQVVPTPGANDPLPRIAAVAAGLDRVDELPLADAAVTFDELHNELQDALADLDRA